jgi:hypothetical protein
MRSTVSVQIFQSLSPKDLLKFEKFLASPYFNHREDVRVVFRLLMEQAPEGLDKLSKMTVFERVFPGEPFDNLRLNYVLNFFSERLEQFLACEEMHQDPFERQFLRCRAFRKRGLSRHFEKNAKELATKQEASTLRNAQHWLQTYQLEREIFAQQMMSSRNAPDNLAKVTNALAQFITLESLQWASTAHALSAISTEDTHVMPYTEAALEFTESSGEPAAVILKKSFEVLHNPNDEAAFLRLKALIREHSTLFSPIEARDIYMSAINYCIKKHNQGERLYTREALELYKEGLEREILLENGVLPKYTYSNINNLSHLVGDAAWAVLFLEQYKHFLPLAERESVYKYNIAIHHFRCSAYPLALELLRDIEFTEVFVNLDVRKMLVRCYFELGEWQALNSLLDSFHAYLRRLKKIGYHRESYLNFIKFTLKVEKTMRSNKTKRAALSRKIIDTKYVAEREWLLGKLG